MFLNKSVILQKRFKKARKQRLKQKNTRKSREKKKNNRREKLVLIKIQRRNKKEEKIKKLAR